MVDANNGITEDGPFSTNRCCTVPVGGLVENVLLRKVYPSGDEAQAQRSRGVMYYLGENGTPR